MHPMEGGRKRPFAPQSRRDFLRTAGISAAGLPLASAILAACGDDAPPTAGPNEDQAAQAAEIIAKPARLDNPVTLPINEQLMIDDNLKPEAGPLELYNWEEYIKPLVVEEFEDLYHVKVNVNTFNTMNEGISKVTGSADSNFDVMVTDVDHIGKLSLSGIIRPLNHTYLANLSNTWDRFHADQSDQPWYDVGAHYSVPYTTYTTGVAWRIDMGGPGEDEVPSMPNPWEILWDTRWKGYIHILDDYREAIGMAFLKNGVTDVNADDPSTRAANLAKAQEDLLRLVSEVDVKADIQDYVDMPEGNSIIHHGWSGDFLAAKWYFPAGTKDRDVIRYWTPADKMPIGNDTFVIPQSGKNPVLAHHFLNYMLDHDVALNNFQWNGYVPPQKDVVPADLLNTSGKVGGIVLPGLENAINTEEEFSKGVVFGELTPDVNSQFLDVWEAFKTGVGS